MPLRFSDDGPELPDALLNDLLAGEVVFVCGAGVSAPQLPNFADLVSQVFTKMSAEFEPGEKKAFEDQRYEEVLGSLSRRLVDNNRMYQAVRGVLATPDCVNLTNHEIVLRLSRNMDNRVCIVTTNFDALFELALEKRDGAGAAVRESVAGQSLPRPGTDGFGGVIHLHGRLPERSLGLGETPLVLTSAEYGEAYMRSGWASRFLFDLARCKSIVLLGYSAGDAPVRYFLNILEADRARFSDLKAVYAFADVSIEKTEADARWSTIAVQPITYKTSCDEPSSHGVLWHDLAELAELVERPKRTLQRRLHVLLSTPCAEMKPDRLTEVEWILRARDDLWDVVVDTIEDPAWFDHIIAQNVLNQVSRPQVLVSWCSKDWNNKVRIEAAARWAEREEGKFGFFLERQLNSAGAPEGLLLRAWHLLAKADKHRAHLASKNDHYLPNRLIIDNLLNLEISDAVDALTPYLKIEPRSTWRMFQHEEETEDSEPENLRDFYSRSLRVDHDRAVTQIGGALLNAPDYAVRVFELINVALKNSIYLAQDAELIGPDGDLISIDIPSIEDHEQNAYHNGLIHLVKCLVGLLPEVSQRDVSFARRIIGDWRTLPGRLGVRLWLHAQRDSALFTVDEVAANVVALSHEDFWAHQRELIVLMAERLVGAAAEGICAIVERIAIEGPERLADEKYIKFGETDWRPAARDHAMWVRLLAIKRAGVLTQSGADLLGEIMGRTTALSNDYEESDLFSIYSSGVESIVGDPDPFVDAEPQERLKIAHSRYANSEFHNRDGWSAFCGVDPAGAFHSLNAAGLRGEDLGLWRDLIQSLLNPTSSDAEFNHARASVFKNILSSLNHRSNAEIAALVPSIINCFKIYPNVPKRARMIWWDRLWKITDETQVGNSDDEYSNMDFYTRVINHPAGKLAEEIIGKMDSENKKRGAPSRATMARARLILSSSSMAGHFARGAFAGQAGFIAHVDQAFTARHFVPYLQGDEPRAAQLRSVVAEWARLGHAASKIMKNELVQAAIESQASTAKVHHVAAKILLPLIMQQLNEGSVDWGFNASDAQRVLKNGSENLRIGAADCLLQWQRNTTDVSPEDFWARGIKPLFNAVWPQERKFLTQQIAVHLAELATKTGSKFPEAVETLSPFFRTLNARGLRMPIGDDSELPTRFPDETLNFLWLHLRGHQETILSLGLAAVLRKLEIQKPALITDRRFQQLEARALRFA